MADIEKQAQAILLRARQKAEAMLVEAQREGEDSSDRPRRGTGPGFDEGLAKGMEEGGKLGHEQALEENREQLTLVVAALERGRDGAGYQTPRAGIGRDGRGDRPGGQDRRAGDQAAGKI